MSRQRREADAGKNEAGQDSDREDIVLDTLSPWRIQTAKDNPLYLVVISSASLEGIGSGLSGEVVEICLQQPKRL